jgi:hypothetical protein
LLPGGLSTATSPEGIALLGVREYKLVRGELGEGWTPETATATSTPEAEFLDVIGIKVFRVFHLTSHSHLY